MENLYDTLKSKVTTNVDKFSELEDEKREALREFQYRQAFIRNNYNVNTTIAYYYYQYFITDFLPILIKECINNSSEFLNMKQKVFNYELQVSKNHDRINQFIKSSNVFYISLGDYIIYKEFINYLNAFCLRCGIDITDQYINGQTYKFNNTTISDIINAYYGELQRFEYTDELIKSIQEEENTNVNGEKVIKTIKTR